MFSSKANTSEAARDRWCCQLCVKLVTELSARRSSHLRSWQPTVVSEQQTHFSITPLSLIPPPLLPLCSFYLTFFFCSLISSFVFSALYSSPSSFLLSCLFYFLTCTLLSHIVLILLSAIHRDTPLGFYCSPPHFLTQFSIFLYSLWLTHVSSPTVFTFYLHLSPLRNFHFSLSPT